MRLRLQPALVLAPPSLWRSRIIAVAASVVLAGSLVGGPRVTAQDGTSGAPPLQETACVLTPASSVEAILGEAILGDPDGAATPAATPITATIAAVEATPSEPGATPAVRDTTVNEAGLLLEDLTAAATSLTSCLTEERFSDAAARTSPLFRGQLIGTPEPVSAELFESLAATFPETSYTIVEIGSPMVLDPAGVASAQIIWQVGYQVRVDQWTFVLGEVQGVTMWIVERAEPGTLDPGFDAEVVEVTIAENRYALSEESVPGDTIRFDATNTDTVDHEVLVLRLDGGADTSELLTTPGPSLPEGVSFVGQATIPANASGRLLLTGLEPGRYAIVDLLLDSDGAPHLADGMEIEFVVK
jgi:hypothetical protein